MFPFLTFRSTSKIIRVSLLNNSCPELLFAGPVRCFDLNVMYCRCQRIIHSQESYIPSTHISKSSKCLVIICKQPIQKFNRLCISFHGISMPVTFTSFPQCHPIAIYLTFNKNVSDSICTYAIQTVFYFYSISIRSC